MRNKTMQLCDESFESDEESREGGRLFKKEEARFIVCMIEEYDCREGEKRRSQREQE